MFTQLIALFAVVASVAANKEENDMSAGGFSGGASLATEKQSTLANALMVKHRNRAAQELRDTFAQNVMTCTS